MPEHLITALTLIAALLLAASLVTAYVQTARSIEALAEERRRLAYRPPASLYVRILWAGASYPVRWCRQALSRAAGAVLRFRH